MVNLHFHGWTQCTSAFDSKFDRSGWEGMLFDDVVIGRIETSTRQCKKNRNSSNLIVANKWWKESIGCGLCSNWTWIAQSYSLPPWLLEIGMICRIMKGNSIFYHLNPRMYCWTNATLLYLFCCVWASLQMVIMEVNWKYTEPRTKQRRRAKPTAIVWTRDRQGAIYLQARGLSFNRSSHV